MDGADLLRQVVIVIAGVLYVVAIVPYLVALHKKQIRPHPVSWLLWTVIGAVNLVFYRQTGATYTQIIAYTSFFLPLVIFIFSLKSWGEKFSKIDYFCLVVSLFSLIFGLVYQSPVLGLTLNILLSDFIAFIPTIVKTFKEPTSENKATWGITIFANILTMSVITKWTFAIVLLPLYTLIMNLVVFVATFKKTSEVTHTP